MSALRKTKANKQQPKPTHTKQNKKRKKKPNMGTTRFSLFKMCNVLLKLYKGFAHYTNLLSLKKKMLVSDNMAKKKKGGGVGR
jgi:hypothetical protein